MKTNLLKASERTARGTRACRKLRQSGFIPVNCYSAQEKDGKTSHETLSLQASAYDIMQILAKHGSLLDLQFGKRKELAVMREIQRDSFGDDVLHIDLQMIDANKPIEFPVDLILKGEAKGARTGGRLIAQLRQLVVKALPAKIPAEIIVKVDDLEIDMAVYVRDLKLPEGVTTAVSGDAVIVQCLPPLTEEQLASTTTAAAPGAIEPELIVKPKKDEDGEAAPAEGGA